MRSSILILTSAFALTASAAGTAAAQPPDGQIVVVPGDHNGVTAPPHVGVGATAPGQAGQPGHGSVGGGGDQSSAGGGPPPVCDYTPATQTPEQMAAQFPDWNAGSIGGDGKAVYYKKCGGRLFGWVTGPGPGGGQVVLPTPEQLAAQAYDQLVLPLPVPRHSPDVRLADGRSATLVGEHTWVWTEPSMWGPQSKRVQAGPVWAEVTARPQTMTFDSGFAGSRSCLGPGTPYARSYGLHAASPDCDFVYPRSSFGLAGDQVTARYAIAWRVDWVGSTGSAPAGGSLPAMTSRASAVFAVAEAQALRTG
jgi:hypothetical protein